MDIYSSAYLLEIVFFTPISFILPSTLCLIECQNKHFYFVCEIGNGKLKEELIA